MSNGMAASQPTTLKATAKQRPRPLHVGTCVMPDLLLDDPAYAQVIEREFTHVVVEHHLKWGPLCSRPESMWGGPKRKGRKWSTLSGCYDFGPSDCIVDWALERGLVVKGHVLLWHVTSPPWLEELTPEQLREALRRHIFTTVGHFRGRIHMWDVANECLAPDGSLADTLFLRKLGQSYIDDAFRWAREAAGPDACLIYNDNKVEGALEGNEGDARYCADFYRKADALFDLMRGMLGRGVPVDGVGLQAHFTASGTGLRRCPTPAAMAANVRRLGALGLRVNISEMDVRVQQLPEAMGEAERDAVQAQIYRDIIQECAREDAFDGITFWGFTDKHSWVHQFYDQDTPLLFDADYRPKPAWHAVCEALAQQHTEPGNMPQQSPPAAPWGDGWMQPEPEQAADGRGTTGCPVASAGDARPDWVLEQQQRAVTNDVHASKCST